MLREKTFVMLKPDCLKRGLVGNVISRIENKGWHIIEAKTRSLDPAFLYEFYDHIKDKPYFLPAFNYMLSGVVLGMIVEGEDAINGMRRLIGPTVIEDALPGTIRGDFATSSSSSLIHASRTAEHFNTETKIFFET